MSVRRIVESPRVTKPYSDEQWRAIDAFGRQRRTAARQRRRARHDRRRADVRRDGRSRRRRVEHRGRRTDEARVRGRPDPAPARALRAARPAALRPGQVVPRRAAAALGLLLVLAPRREAAVARRRARRRRAQGLRRHAPSRRGEFLRGVARPARARRRSRDRRRYEDPWHFIGQERRLPENLEAATNKLDDPMARARLARVFERGLGKPVGYVLPVQRWNAQARDVRRWNTAHWTHAIRQVVPDARRLAARFPVAAAVAAVHLAGRVSLRDPVRSRSPSTASCPSRIRCASRFCAASSARPAASAARRSVPRRARWRAPRSPSSRATGASACSCRRSPSSRTTSTSSPRSRTRRPSSSCRSISKATSRRAIRA